MTREAFEAAVRDVLRPKFGTPEATRGFDAQVAEIAALADEYAARLAEQIARPARRANRRRTA